MMCICFSITHTSTKSTCDTFKTDSAVAKFELGHLLYIPLRAMTDVYALCCALSIIPKIDSAYSPISLYHGNKNGRIIT